MDDKELAARVEAERARCAADLPYYAAGYLMIRTNTGERKPLALNRCQMYYHEKVEEQKRRTGRVRVICLKGRKMGVSTYVEGRAYHRATHAFGQQVFILTHEERATKALFGMAKRYHELMNPAFRPDAGAMSTKEMTFPGLDSRYEVATAGTEEVGRSQTTQFFHGSEVAFWPNAENHARGALETVPDALGTEIHLESTANGIGNWFHRQWKLAVAGRSEFIPIFLPWFWHHEYTVRPEEVPEDFELTRTDYAEIDGVPVGNEVEIQNAYGLTREQMYWRRKRIMKYGDLESFLQEYPCTPDEAFLFSGRTFFPKRKIEAMRLKLKKPIAVGGLEQVNTKVSFIPYDDGDLEIFEMPDPECDYAIGVDTSDGTANGNQNSINVFKRGMRWEQVARWAPQVAPDKLGRMAVLLALFYRNGTPLGIERNNMGVAAVVAAMDTEYEYLYRDQKYEGHDKEEEQSGKIGWITNTATREVGLNHLLAAVRDDSIVIRSEATLSQFSTFVRNAKTGKPEAMSGCQDDEVISCMISVEMILRTEPERPDAVFSWGSGTDRQEGSAGWTEKGGSRAGNGWMGL